MITTVQDFSLEMGMHPYHMIGIPVTGDQSCGVLTCAQINKMVADLAWSESLIDNALKKYGKSLYHQSKTLTSDAPYFWIKEENVVPGKIEVVRVTADVVVVGDLATITALLTDEQFDSTCDKVISVSVVDECGILCPKKLQPKWRELNQPEAEISGYSITLDTDSYALTVCQCDESGCDEPDEITVDISILKPSLPRMGSYSGGCDDSETECAICGGFSTVEGCIARKSKNTFVAEFDNCSCACSGGSTKIYELDVVILPVEADSAMINAIISLANTRKALNGCELCSPESQERIRLDLGILDDGGSGAMDQRAQSAYMFTNPFGILMPGALFAWRTIQDKVAGIGGAGHF